MQNYQDQAMFRRQSQTLRSKQEQKTTMATSLLLLGKQQAHHGDFLPSTYCLLELPAPTLQQKEGVFSKGSEAVRYPQETTYQGLPKRRSPEPPHAGRHQKA